MPSAPNGVRFRTVTTMRSLVILLALLLVGCAPVTNVTTPSPYADIAPAPVPQVFECSITGDNAAFDMACVEPSPTPTATPEPAFWYFWCNNDTRCATGQFRVYWDRDGAFLRCAQTQGAKVTLIANGYSMREGEGEPLAWVVTGADAGGVPCEGWVPMTFLRAAE